MLNIKDIHISVKEDPDTHDQIVTAGVQIKADAIIDGYAMAQAKGDSHVLVERAAQTAQAKVYAYLYSDIRGIFADLIYQLRRDQPSALNTERDENLRRIEKHLGDLGLL